MAIKVKCGKCGYLNELGRLFCLDCGAKLDLNSIRARDFQASWYRVVWTAASPILARLLAVAVLGALVLALWPASVPRVLIDQAGAFAVPMKAKAARAAALNSRTASLQLSEGELNGFLQERARTRHLTQLVIDLKPGRFSLHARGVWFSVPALAYSIEMTGSFRQGVLTVESAEAGHLPLPGLLRWPVVRVFSGIFDDVVREQALITTLKTVAIEETRADIALGP